MLVRLRLGGGGGGEKGAKAQGGRSGEEIFLALVAFAPDACGFASFGRDDAAETFPIWRNRDFVWFPTLEFFFFEISSVGVGQLVMRDGPARQAQSLIGLRALQDQERMVLLRPIWR